MGLDTSSILSLAPLSDTSPVGAQSLQITADLAQSPGTEPGGIFARLLSQLLPETPADSPLLPETISILPAETAIESDPHLPLTGNALPPVTLTAPTLIEVTADDLVDFADKTEPLTIETAEVVQLPVTPVTVLPQEVLPKPALSPDTPGRRPGVIPGPVTADSTVVPLLQSAPPGSDPLLASNAFSATPVLKATENVANELVAQTLVQQQPATPGAAAANPATITAPAALQTQPLASPTPQQPLILDHPVADSRWGESLGQRIMWMTDNGMGQAKIRLNPPELGPLEVRIAVAKDEAKVAFTVQHGATREAVEAALPRLREMFASQGIDLTDSSVSQQPPGEQQLAGDRGNSMEEGGAGDSHKIASEESELAIQDSAMTHTGLIDTYA